MTVLQMTDKFKMHRFHHIEYWCPDATNAYKRYEAETSARH